MARTTSALDRRVRVRMGRAAFDAALGARGGGGESAKERPMSDEARRKGEGEGVSEAERARRRGLASLERRTCALRHAWHDLTEGREREQRRRSLTRE